VTAFARIRIWEPALPSTRVAFALVVVMLLPLMLFVSHDFGATWDEPQQRDKGLRLLAYLAGESPVLVNPIDGAHLYGAPLDLLSAAAERVTSVDPYVIRHAAIAIVGWLGLVLCGLLADRLFGPPHGLLTLLLLAACPWYIGHAMNNPKDLPFATVATGLLLALTYSDRHAPYFSWKLTFTLALIIGASLNVRPGGLLFIAYVGVLVLVRILITGPLPARLLAVVGTRVALVALGAISIGWVAWPWAYSQPFAAPFRALAELGHFGWGGRVLFAGSALRGTELPVDYVLRWFWMVLPPVLLVGLALSFLRLRDDRWVPGTIGLWSAVLFPIVYVVGTHATLYDGVRHLLFVLPPIAVLAASGWMAAYEFVPLAARRIVGALLLVGFIEPLAFQWRNHPNQTVYIQPLAGGPRAIYARYDLDYWGNCMLQALDRINSTSGNGPVRVTGWPMIVLQADITRFPKLALTEPGDPSATYFVRLARGERHELLQLSSAQRQSVQIRTADGALLCTVGPVDPLATSR
jgi:hypothetical protein